MAFQDESRTYELLTQGGAYVMSRGSASLLCAARSSELDCVDHLLLSLPASALLLYTSASCRQVKIRMSAQSPPRNGESEGGDDFVHQIAIEVCQFLSYPGMSLTR